MNWNLLPVAEYERLAPVWDEINEAAGALPFMQARFIGPLCQIFGHAGLQIALAESVNKPMAIGILARRGPGQWETFQPSQLPLGAWLMRPGQDFHELLSSLAKKLPGVALAVGITQQDPDHVDRPAHTALLRTIDYIRTARIRLAESFEEYWQKRGKNLRHNMKRQRAKLAQQDVTTHLETLTHPNDVACAIEDYGRLEAAGWKAGHGTDVRSDNNQGRFYKSILEAFCRTGHARIYRYRIGDRVAAIDLCILCRGTLVILKTAYDESTNGFSPAFLMREESFRGLFEEKRVERIEFFGKLMEWHTRWTDDIRMLYHVNYYRTSVLRLLAGSRAGYRGSEPAA